MYAYASAVGSLVHLMICTRPDITFASGYQAPREEHTGWLFNGFLDTRSELKVPDLAVEARMCVGLVIRIMIIKNG